MRRKRLIAGAVVLVPIAAAFIAYDLYFHKKPEDMANDLRADAKPAATRITDG